MEAKEKINLIERGTEEILTSEDLKLLIESKTPLKHYIGFEISGKIHLGTGLVCMRKVKDFMDANVRCTVFLADWHTWINDKLGGDRKVIQAVAVGYFKEGLKASLKCVGGNPDNLDFVLGSDLYEKTPSYWDTFIEVSKNVTLARIKRSITIMGRKEGENVDFAKLVYPSMQVADIFAQQINIAHAGADQRKAHVIARDVALKLNIKPLLDNKGNKIKPIAIHHRLLLGLGKPPVWPVPKDIPQDFWTSVKMSKSKPDTCVFIHDSPEKIKEKINKAFCLEGDITYNPILNWAKLLIFIDNTSKLEIERPPKFGGDLTINSYENLERLFANKEIHPMDLKNSIANKLIQLLKPAREHFSTGEPKKMLERMEGLVK